MNAHRLVRPAAILAAVISILVALPSAFAFWSASATGTGRANTGVLGAPDVTAPATSGPNVAVSWTAATTPSNTALDGYYVERFDAGGTASAACGSSPASLTVQRSCNDTVAAGGDYTYRVTAVLHSWTATSAASGSVRVTVARPSLTLAGPADGSSTTNPSPTVTGSTDTAAPVTVDIYAGPTVTGTPTQILTATPDGGSWSVTPAPLADGSYTVTASQANGAGTTTTAGNTFTVVTTVPAVIVTSPSNGATTTSTRPTFSGTASWTTPVTVTVYAGTTPTDPAIQTVVVTPTGGTWSAPAGAALADGTYTVRATQTNPAGTGTSAAITFDVLTTVPALAITAPADGATVTVARPTLSGRASGGSTVTVRVYAGPGATGSPVQTLTTTPVNGAWTATPSTALVDGTYTATASQTNAAGTGTSAANTFAVLTTAPTVTLTAPAGGAALSTNKPTYSGAASGTGTVTVRIFPGSGTTGTPVQTLTATPTNGTWSVPATTALADGAYTAQASQTNAAGTGTSTANTFSVITTALTVTINQASGQADPTKSTPINYAVVFSRAVTGFSASGVTLGGTSGGSRTVTVTGSGSSYTVAVTGMTDGTVTASVKAGAATDAAGNSNTASTSTDNTVTYDSTPPALPSGLSYTDSNGADKVSGKAEAGSTVTVRETAPNSSTFTATAAADGSWTVTVEKIAGTASQLIAYNFSVTATDLAGNTSGVATLTGNDRN